MKVLVKKKGGKVWMWIKKAREEVVWGVNIYEWAKRVFSKRSSFLRDAAATHWKTLHERILKGKPEEWLKKESQPIFWDRLNGLTHLLHGFLSSSLKDELANPRMLGTKGKQVTVIQLKSLSCIMHSLLIKFSLTILTFI